MYYSALLTTAFAAGALAQSSGNASVPATSGGLNSSAPVNATQAPVTTKVVTIPCSEEVCQSSHKVTTVTEPCEETQAPAPVPTTSCVECAEETQAPAQLQAPRPRLRPRPALRLSVKPRLLQPLPQSQPPSPLPPLPMPLPPPAQNRLTVLLRWLSTPSPVLLSVLSPSSSN